MRGAYDLGAEVGAGGFGVVYECTEIATGKLYAAKLVFKANTPMDAIVNEAKVLESLDHPRIMKFRALLFERTFVCIVATLYSGGDLIGAMLEQWGRGDDIPQNSTIFLTQQVVEAITYLHAHNVIHRDIKPDNCLLDRPDLSDPELQMVLSDFGSAKFVVQGERMDQQTGTPEYWSPEVYNRDYDVKADVWAAGVVLYSFLTRKLPFRNEEAARTKRIRPPANATSACMQLLAGMLSRSEDKRFSAAECLAHDCFGDGHPGSPTVSATSSQSSCLTSSPTSSRSSAALKPLERP